MGELFKPGVIGGNGIRVEPENLTAVQQGVLPVPFMRQVGLQPLEGVKIRRHLLRLTIPSVVTICIRVHVVPLRSLAHPVGGRDGMISAGHSPSVMGP